MDRINYSHDEDSINNSFGRLIIISFSKATSDIEILDRHMVSIALVHLLVQ